MSEILLKIIRNCCHGCGQRYLSCGSGSNRLSSAGSNRLKVQTVSPPLTQILYSSSVHVKLLMVLQSQYFGHAVACSHFEQVFASMQSFREEHSFCDTVIQGSSREFRAHSVVLAAASSVLKSTIQKDGSPGITYRIKLQEVEDNVIEIALHYIYTGELLLPSVFVAEMSGLLVALNKLGLEPHKFGGCKIRIKSKDFSTLGEENLLHCNTSSNNLRKNENGSHSNTSNFVPDNILDLNRHCIPECIEPNNTDDDDTETDQLETSDPLAVSTDKSTSQILLISSPNDISTINNSLKEIVNESKTDINSRNKQKKVKPSKKFKKLNANPKYSGFDNMTDGIDGNISQEQGSEILAKAGISLNGKTLLEEKHICSVCNKIFSTRNSWKRHSLIHTKVKPDTYSECEKEFTNPANVQKRNKSRTGVKSYFCESCGKGYTRNLSLQEHINKHHSTNKKLFKCASCDKSFLVSSSLRSHIARCHRDRGLTRKHLCDFCGKEFFRAYYLKIHIMSHHTDEKPYVCNICGKHFPGMLNLKKHEQYYHKTKLGRTKDGLGPHICLTCGKEYAYAYYLKVHNRSVHFGEKPYVCSYCERGFSTKHVLEEHLRVHTKERPHACEFCVKRFTCRSAWRIHRRIHTGERPFKCTICMKGFGQHQQLVRHVLIHTGEKPHSCSMCEKTYKQRQDLRIHCSRVHQKALQNSSSVDSVL